MAALIAEKFYIFYDKRIFALCSRHVNVAVLIKADSFMVGYAVTKSLYLLKLVEHRSLPYSGGSIWEYTQ